MTPERWQNIKQLVNSALAEDAEARTALLQQSCAEDFGMRLGAEALLSATRQFPDAPLEPDEWQRIEKLFQSALELEPAKRAAYLADACGDDEALRHEVESLLVYQGAAGGIIQGAIHEAAGLLPNDTKARFTPGTTLNKRYRILGQLGKGGMGEVYRADDLKLGQPVALKFLTAKLSQDKAMLARFHSEVAMAHRVTHPNVCRVHDIGDVTTSAGNLHFLSMEYVDGEDLSSLLRRIGRLPSDKAVEIATQLCAGLSAAHEASVLHRDLKPANVMIDGKGRVRITDFGLAGFAEQIKGNEVFAGTPAYMSPEQFAGKEVTTKSDIYALGLVLYEIFTGKRVFEAGSLDELKRMHESSAPTTPSSWVKDIDPLVKRVILRCLEKDPGRRLASAKQVADALPGGDPLAAALALGETPSPEMVAAAGQKTGLRPALAVAYLIAIVIGVIAVVILDTKTNLLERMPFDNSPEIMAGKSREILSQLGYPNKPFDTAYAYAWQDSYLSYIRNKDRAQNQLDDLLKARPSVVEFWYRESASPLIPDSFLGNSHPAVGWSDPPLTRSDMISIKLDPSGRLLSLVAVPPQVEKIIDTSNVPSDYDWSVLFRAAGIDSTLFSATKSEWVPPTVYDARAAWKGAFSTSQQYPIRIEAAAYRGKPVYFDIIGPWSKPDREYRHEYPSPTLRIIWGIILALLVLVPLIGLWLVRRNLHAGRGDRQGAFRLGAVVFVIGLLGWGLRMKHVPEEAEIFLLWKGVLDSLWVAALIWTFYLALEPYVRKRWPNILISWSRVLTGKLRDSLVGKDVLAGIFFIGVIRAVTIGFSKFAAIQQGRVAYQKRLEPMTSLPRILGELLLQWQNSMLIVLGFLLVFFLLRTLLRRQWLAVVVYVVVRMVMVGFTLGSPESLGIVATRWIDAFLEPALFIFVMMRFGLLGTVAGFLALGLLMYVTPLTTHFSLWYAGGSIIPIVVVLALSIYAFHTSLGGQKVFAGKLLEE